MIYKSKIFKKLAEDEKDQNFSIREKELDHLLNKYNLEKSNTVFHGTEPISDDNLSKDLTKSLLIKYIADDIGAVLTKNISNKSSFIGSGAFSAVYDCIYNGKHAALKVTDQKEDYVAYRKLQSIHDSLGEYSKYFVNIFLTKDIQANNKTYYVIVSEILQPLEVSIKHELFNDKFTAEDSLLPDDNELTIELYNHYKVLVKEFVDNDMCGDSYNPAFNYLKIDKKGSQEKYNRMINFLLNRITKITKDSSSIFIYSIYKEIVNYIVLQIKEFSKYNYDKSTNNYVKSIINDLFRFTFRIDVGEKLTRDHRDATIDAVSDDFSEFTTALTLAVRKGFAWSDLSINNVMQRPGTKIPVVSDVGLFEIY